MNIRQTSGNTSLCLVSCIGHQGLKSMARSEQGYAPRYPMVKRQTPEDGNISAFDNDIMMDAGMAR
jgi:hypothetical protein